jgi:trimeric autotransporter adhesin
MQQAAARTILSFAFILFTKLLLAQTQSDDCATPVTLTPGTTCVNTTSTLFNATSSGIAGSCTGTKYDVWYTFTTPANCTSVDINMSDIAAGGSNLTAANTYMEAFNGPNCGATSISSCTPMGTTLALTGLAPSTSYRLRVFTWNLAPTAGNSGKWDFNICITYTPPPANDDCSGAITLSSASSCSNTAGTIVSATASTGLPIGCESGGTHYDVWYKFVATNTTHTVTISSVANFTTSEIQLYGGNCGSLTSLGCGSTSVGSGSLAIGSTYYIRVSNIASAVSTNGTFNICVTNPAPPVIVTAGRMNEVYKQTILSGAGGLQYPWEVTYGPDGNLWITESRGYKVYKMNPSTGAKITALDISFGSTSSELTTAEHTTFNVQFNNSGNVAGCSCWPQGGLAGLAIHPQFNSGKPYVYVSYIRKFDSTSSTTNGGVYFRNSVVRFTYNSSSGKLESPVAICDTLPGSSDHNSQRIIVAPVAGTYYLFYAQGDMGAGQFGNQFRPNKAQNSSSYEGKILRFNLEADADAGSYDQWIPNDNPYNGAKQSAVWCIGIRNNQGLAYDASLNMLYGASHGPYSDDEINIIEQARNYGHPLIEGFVSDGNCNGTTAGTAPNMSGGGSGSSCPTINEAAAAAAIGASYKDPLFSAYPNSVAFPSILNLWNTTTGANANWPTEAWSGLDLYNNTLVPGWKNSLVAASLKWGRLVRLRLNAAGTATAPNNSVGDTISYFNCQNRFRDLAFSPDGKDIYVIMDNSSTTSGPGNLNPVVPQCAGCVQKYTFLGYADVSGKSSIPASIDVTAGSPNACTTGTTITIDNENSNYWVPITGPDGNIMAEIYANGNILGTVTSSFYTNSSGIVRMAGGTKYLDRNMTITPQFQPSSTVKIRLYMSKAEFDALDADPLGGVTAITDLKILKNTDPCSSSLSNTTTLITPTFAEAHGTGGYVLQGNISSFSSFYFASSNIALPQQLLAFTGSLQSDGTHLNWESANEVNTSNYILERSTDGADFRQIATVPAKGNSSNSYSYLDFSVGTLMSPVVYYRLKIVDNNGSFAYSKVVSVTFNSSYTVDIYPNPMHEVLKIKLSLVRAQNLQINVTDVKGHTIYRKSRFAGAGNGEFEINTKNWPSQMYSVKILGNNQEVLAIKNVIKL